MRENKRALSPAVRAERLEEIKQINERIRENEQQQKLAPFKWQELLASAEFFLAVNGDEPSASQFKEKVAAGRKLADLQEEFRALKSERTEKSGFLHSKRYEAGCYQKFPGIGYISECHASADMLTDLLAKVRSKSS